MANTLPNLTPFSNRFRLSPARAILVVAGLCVVGAAALDAQTESPPLVADKPAADPQHARAAALISDARERLRSYASIRADLLETMLVGNRRYQAEGSYLQGSDRQVRLSYKIALQSTGSDSPPIEGSLLEVSDGNIAQTSYKIGKEERITRRDLKQIYEALAKSSPPGAELEATRLGFGGIPSLLASFERSLIFDEVVEEEISGTRYLVLKGSWTADAVKRFRSKDDQPLPGYLPDRVWLYLDEATLFPRRVFYLKVFEERLNPLMTLDFQNIRTNVPVSSEEFFFVAPKDVVVEDITQQMIQEIRSAAAARDAANSASPAAK